MSYGDLRDDGCTLAADRQRAEGAARRDLTSLDPDARVVDRPGHEIYPCTTTLLNIVGRRYDRAASQGARPPPAKSHPEGGPEAHPELIPCQLRAGWRFDGKLACSGLLPSWIAARCPPTFKPLRRRRLAPDESFFVEKVPCAPPCGRCHGDNGASETRLNSRI